MFSSLAWEKRNPGNIIRKRALQVRRKIARALRRFLRISDLLADARFIIAYARRHRISVIWFGYGNISYDLMRLIKQRASGLKLVCDTDSVWSRFILRELPYETDPEKIDRIKAEGRAKEREEREWVRFCDVTTAVSEVDAKYYRSLLDSHDERKIRIFSNAINLETYKDRDVPMPAGYNKPAMFLAGSFGPGSAMDKAARWVIEEVMPIVEGDVPDIHFYIAGVGSRETLYDIGNENISVVGKVKSVLPYLLNSDVSIVSLKFESGTRFKILEAGACRAPIVSTVLGAEGLSVENGTHLLIADEAEAFANAIVSLIRNPALAARLAGNCYELVSSTYSIENLSRQGVGILADLAGADAG